MRYVMESEREGRRVEAKTDDVLTVEQLKWAGVAPGARVLDLGCAAGTTTRIIAELVGPSGTVVGVDASLSRISEARAVYSTPAWVEYLAGDAEQIPVQDQEFDIVWARFLFEYLPDPTAVLSEMIRVTRGGGTVVISDVDGNGLWHHPYPPSLADDMNDVVETLSRWGFDPFVGRKLYPLAWEAGLSALEVDVRAYHVIAGRVDETTAALWDLKIMALSETLRALGWSDERTSRIGRGYRQLLQDSGTFSYDVLISVKGTRRTS